MAQASSSQPGAPATTVRGPASSRRTASPSTSGPAALELGPATGDEHVHRGGVRQRHRPARRHPGAVQDGAPGTERHRCPAAGERDQAAALQVAPGVVLGVGRRGPGLVGEHPHLHEPHRAPGRGVVALGVQHPAPGAEPLHEPGHHHAGVAPGVLVAQAALEHPGDDLQVAVRVAGVAAAGCDHVVVVRDEQRVPDVGRVVVRGEGEGVARHDAVVLAAEALGRRAYVDGHAPMVAHRPTARRGVVTRRPRTGGAARPPSCGGAPAWRRTGPGRRRRRRRRE